MDPLSDDELSEILRQLEFSPAPRTLEARLFPLRNRQIAGLCWRRTLSYSVKIPVPAIVLAVLAFFALSTFAFRTNSTIPFSARTRSTDVPSSKQLISKAPSVASKRAGPTNELPQPRSGVGTGHARTASSDSPAARIDDSTLGVTRAAAGRNLVTSPEPYYPPNAKNAGLQGTVRLQVRIDKEGRVSDATVISGNPVLESAAIEAVKQRVYRPTLLNGNPIAVVSQVDVVFRLDVALISSLMQ